MPNYRMGNASLIFETQRLIVRRYAAGDQDNFFLLNGDPEIMRYIRPAKTREESDRFLQEVIAYSEQNLLYGRWAAIQKEDDHFVGSFACIPIENSVEMQLGYSLLQPEWGKGFATELTLAGLRYVFTQTELREIFGITEAANTASQKVLLKAGFSYFKTYLEGEKELFKYQFLKKDFEPLER